MDMVRLRMISIAAALSLAVVLPACHRSPADLRPWTARDHDSGPADPAPPADDDPLAAARSLWSLQCAGCHGPGGQGNGPQAAMLGPADLTAATLQAGRSDEDLTQTITQGHGRMPAFGARIGPDGVAALVRLIRSFRH